MGFDQEEVRLKGFMGGRRREGEDRRPNIHQEKKKKKVSEKFGRWDCARSAYYLY